MGLEIRDFEALVEDTLQEIVDSGVGITNVTVGSVTRTLVEAVLANIDQNNYYIEYVYNAMGIDTAIGEDLDRLVAILGIVRQQPSKALAVVTFSTGDSPYQYDITIPYGYEVSTRQSSDGTIYTFNTVEEVTLKAGQTEIDVVVRASEAGRLYLPVGAISVMGRSIIGIATVINKDEVNGGSDIETDNELRKRAKEYITAFGKCTEAAIKAAVEGVDGIVSCNIIDLYQGAGTIGVIIVPAILPVSDEIARQVNQAIDETKAAGIKPFIIYPTTINVDVDITISEEVDSGLVLKAISDYANSLGVGQTFVIRQMERKILNAIDDNDVESDQIDIFTNLPDHNIVCSMTNTIKIEHVTINGVIYDV